MYTSVASIALSGLLAASPVPAKAPKGPSWQTDYYAARKMGESVKKPLVVVLGQGKAGYTKAIQESQLNADVKHLLAKDFIAVHVDTSTENGKKLAREYEMASGVGIVIGDRTGKLQAFSHEGQLSLSDLAGYLR